MLYCSFIELDALLSVIMIMIYGLFSLRSTQVNLADVFLFCRFFPLLLVLGFYLDMSPAGVYFLTTFNELFASSSIVSLENTCNMYDLVMGSSIYVFSIDFLLALLLFFIMYNFQSFESVLLLLFAFVGQYYMLHSIDLLTFYIALEAQNFCFLVLCGLPTVAYTQIRINDGVVNSKGNRSAIQSAAQKTMLLDANAKKDGFVQNNARVFTSKGNYVFSVEASIKYFLLSAFSSGVLLFWFSAIYLQTGMSIFSFSPKEQSVYASYELSTISVFLILCAMMFKLGAAPLHLWVIQIYNGVKRNLLLYISTAPKLSLFGFWVNSFQTVWTDYTVILFSAFSIILGAFGAYNQPSLRTLLAYSTVNEIGLLLSALETAGFNSLFQHLGIYIISQLLLWNLYDKRIFSVLAVSLAGLPPLAGFFGKSWIFWHIGTTGLTGILLLALLCTGISLVYYIRIIRLFWNANHTFTFKYGMAHIDLNQQRVYLTSACVVLLFMLPIFVIKPFIM